MKKIPGTSSVKMMTMAALFAALTAVGAYISIPIGPVPIVLANLFVLMSGLLLGPRWAAASMGIYLLLGIAGLPVFHGGASGPASMMGPTGGFLLGYVVAAFVMGLITGTGKTSTAKDIAAVLAGIFLIYLAGVPWLKHVMELDWHKAIVGGMLPFIPGDLVKGAAALSLIKLIRPRFYG